MEWSVEEIDAQRFRLIADPNELTSIFKYEETERMYNYRHRNFDFVKVTRYLYDTRSDAGAIFHSGFAAMILYHFKDKLDYNSRYILNNYVNSNRISHDFEELKPVQNEDTHDLLKFNKGIFSVYTGYGKTQIIANLINYIINELHEKVLVITPSSMSLEEIKSRVKKLYGITSEYFNYNSDYNAINVNGFLRSNKFDKNSDYWKTVDWILADEVEYCLTEKSVTMMNLCKNIKHSYGFSGTADKSSGERIKMREGLTDTVKRNKVLISFFGFSIVHRKPQVFDIDMIDIKTSIFDDLKDIRMSQSTIYSEIISNIFTNERFCNGFKKIVEVEKGGLYIPMFRLTVIDKWLKDSFTWKGGKIANIHASGIDLWSEGKKLSSISLDELKEMVDNDTVDVIVGTRSSFRAIDLPNLKKVILLTSQIASNILQQIGRVVRKNKFQVINLIPNNYISCYSGDLEKRKSLIKRYYADCNIRTFKRIDTNYGVY